MKTKKVIKMVLLIFVAVSAGWLIVQQGQGTPNEADSGPSPLNGATAAARESGQTGEAKPGPAVLPNRVIVYYFHTTYRCPTCHKIENYTREAVETGFAQALKEGRLEFHAVNVEEKGNEHYIKDYQLHTKSVVVSDIKDGQEAQWKDLTKVWELTHDKEAFFKYIQDEVNLYLQGK